MNESPAPKTTFPPLLWKPAISPYADLMMAVDYKQVEKDPAVKRLMLTISAIIEQKEPPFNGYDLYLDELDRHMKKDPALKTLISPRVAYFLSQMSVASEGIHQLRLFRPWVAEAEYDMSKYVFSPEAFLLPEMRDVKKYYNEFASRWSGVMGHSLDDYALVRMADPSDGKFEFPVGERRTRTSVKKMQAAKTNLDRFWQRADAYCRKRTGKTFPELLDKDITNGRSIQRTPDWVDPPKATKGKRSQPPPQVEYIYQPFSLRDHDTSSEVTGAFNKLSVSVKEKTKTRGSLTIQDANFPAMGQQNLAFPDPQPEYHLDRRAYKAFRALFYSPFSLDIPGEVPWTDFLHAMASMGFSIEQLHGSAWQFTPKTLDVERAIQFHEPHPASKIPFTWARRFGRRLNRAYGWTGDIFKLS